MEIKSYIHFEVEKHDAKVTFVVPNGTQLGTCFEVLQELLIKVKEIADNHAAEEQKKNASVPVVEMTPEQLQDAIVKE